MIRLLKAHETATPSKVPDVSHAIARIAKEEWEAQVRVRRLQREAVERAKELQKQAQDDIQRQMQVESQELQKKYDSMFAESLIALSNEFENRWQQCQQVVATVTIA